jgi:hypothetical protein
VHAILAYLYALSVRKWSSVKNSEAIEWAE